MRLKCRPLFKAMIILRNNSSFGLVRNTALISRKNKSHFTFCAIWYIVWFTGRYQLFDRFVDFFSAASKQNICLTWHTAQISYKECFARAILPAFHRGLKRKSCQLVLLNFLSLFLIFYFPWAHLFNPSISWPLTSDVTDVFRLNTF